MLGNWSFGDYFKKEAIEWSWEFLTGADWLGLDKNRLAISIFAGDADAPLDKESKSIWLKLGVPETRIKALPKENNWWGPAGRTGPCGPDTEMFYWAGAQTPPVKFDPNDSRWVEIWNDVFMEYDKKPDGSFAPLKQKNVDTGMGVERTLAVLNGLDDDYRSELFWLIIKKIEELSGKKYSERPREMRIIADHIKASVFMAADGVAPSNVERGYVLRRLLRRAMRYGRMLGIMRNFTAELAGAVISMEAYDDYNLRDSGHKIKEAFELEEEKFSNALEKGLKELRKLQTAALGNNIDAKSAFNIYQTYGFPLEMIQEELSKEGKFVDAEQFQEQAKKHANLSRNASAGRFAGGLSDHGEMAVKYHTATHLLQAALRQVLGEHVFQKGSNITAERLRFDFSHPAKMTAEEIKETEELVNAHIQADYPVGFKEMTVAEAQKSGAIGLFAGKYSDSVKVYTIGYNSEAVSREICGGPHVEHTGVLGKFKIIKEEAVSAGVRRIKAVLE